MRRRFTVCLVYFFPIIQKLRKQGRCLNLDDCPNIFNLTLVFSFISDHVLLWMTRHNMAACLFMQIIVLPCLFTIQLNRFVVTYLDINVNI